MLDQADFTVERTRRSRRRRQSRHLRRRLPGEVNYGWDNGLLHSSGIFDNPSTLGVTDGYYRSRTSPENQFDVHQAYLDFALPVGSGLDIRVGKFVTLLGYELINPTQNALFSHSYLFGFAIPLTQTGVLGIVHVQRQARRHRRHHPRLEPVPPRQQRIARLPRRA